jgi:myo-inositol-1(or 4)-monophosphatase
MWEEKSEEITSAKYMRICDPVDWTIPFSHGVPVCVFSLWLLEDGQPIVAVAYDPFMDRLFYASKWNWAFMNWKPIKVGDYDNLNNVLIWMEWWKWMKSIRDYSAIDEYLTETFNCQITKYNSIIYTWMMVASWEFWAILFPWNKPWDMVTIELIVEEAGWKVTNLVWEKNRYDVQWGCFWMIASNGILHDELLTLVKQNLNTQINN